MPETPAVAVVVATLQQSHLARTFGSVQNLHYNMIWDVPIVHQEKFFLEAPGLWREMVPSGQFHLQVIGDEPGEDLAARIYSGKTFHPRWPPDNTIISTELRKKK